MYLVAAMLLQGRVVCLSATKGEPMKPSQPCMVQVQPQADRLAPPPHPIILMPLLLLLPR
jgi:hypothetical protein